MLVPEFHEVCNTIGPNGVLTLRAGVAVIIFDGVEFGADSEVSIEIDPSLVP